MIGKPIKILWKEALHDKSFRNILILTIITLIILLFLLTKFLVYNETRTGSLIDDPLLKLFRPVDVTWFTFILLYTALILGLIFLSREPKRLMTALHAYMIMVLIRIVAMYSLPLNPPAEMIILKDPIVELFGSSDVFLKDLFFSGHTSTMFLLFLTCGVKKLKNLFLATTFLMAGCVLIQHVHYSVDVIVAPFVAYAGYCISIRINNLPK